MRHKWYTQMIRSCELAWSKLQLTFKSDSHECLPNTARGAPASVPQLRYWRAAASRTTALYTVKSVHVTSHLFCPVPLVILIKTQRFPNVIIPDVAILKRTTMHHATNTSYSCGWASSVRILETASLPHLLKLPGREMM